MKKFTYKMENLLMVKLKLEDQAKTAYGNARLRLTKEEEKLQILESNKLAYENEVRIQITGKLNILEIKRCEEAVKAVKESIKQQLTVIRNAVQRLEVARIRLNDAMIERKIQDKLKEKALIEYMVEFEAEERKEIDELNSFKYSIPTSSKEDR